MNIRLIITLSLLLLLTACVRNKAPAANQGTWNDSTWNSAIWQ